MTGIGSKLSTLSRVLHRALASKWFFYGIVAYISLSAFWIAISSLYPMAFDEDFHLGIIKLYAELWNPFAIQQIPEAAPFGSITTDPSYLFHYLMSFPYRLLAAVTTSEVAIVIGLRILNIIFFVLGIVLYQKVLLRAKLSSAIVNVVLAVFVLIPVVPMLAGQINYDNLLMLIAAAVFWLTLGIKERLDASNLPTTQILWLLVLLLFSSVVKYAFLPIAAGVVLYVGYLLYQAVDDKRVKISNAATQLKSMKKPQKIVVVLALCVGMVLCGQRYVVNVVKYHDLVPDCGAVISVEECKQYGPWGRDYRLSQSKTAPVDRGPVEYTATHWLHGMWHRLYFAVAGVTNEHATRKQLPIPSATAIVVVSIGIVLLLIHGKGLLRKYPIFVLFTIVGALYVGAVWLQVYQLYVFTGQPVAINGRYLIPLLPAFGVMLVAAYARFFDAVKLSQYKSVIACLAILLFLQGGGPATYIVRSEARWYWPNSFVQDANMQLQKIIKPFTIGS